MRPRTKNLMAWGLVALAGACFCQPEDAADDEDDCEPGTTSADPNLGTVVCIPSGTFTMGCLAGRDDVAGGCFSDESPAHTVELTRSF